MSRSEQQPEFDGRRSHPSKPGNSREVRRGTATVGQPDELAPVTEGDVGSAVGQPSEPAAGDRLMVGTDTLSGIRSSTARRSVPEHPAPAWPGPTSSPTDRLAREVDDADIVGQFVADYLGLLDERMSRLQLLLASEEAPETIRVHILSLETTSAMLGAGDVVETAAALRRAVAHRQPTTLLFEQLKEATSAARRCLTR